MKNNSTATDIRDELKVTDAELFANLRPEHDGMKPILQKWQTGDLAGAKTE
jgi:hypothetical protein